jgi:zinc D-Ala-D-Ala carboxypeptidase
LTIAAAKLSAPQPIRCSRNFSFAEMVRSQFAIRHGLDNTPPPEACEALIALCERVLEPIRELVGGPLNVSSGYRSPRLNALIGGAPASQHTFGQAADFVTWTSNTNVFEGILASEIPYDQLILEFGDLGWIHVSYRANPRHEALHAHRDGSGRVVYERVR